MKTLTRRSGTGGYHQQPMFRNRSFSRRFSTQRLLVAVGLVTVGVSLLTWFLCYAKS